MQPLCYCCFKFYNIIT